MRPLRQLSSPGSHRPPIRNGEPVADLNRLNLAPTDSAPVVRLAANGERHLDVMKWGLIPYFTNDLKAARKPINARSETIARSGMFKAAFQKRRCLAPATAYYEWMDGPEGKVPFAVARLDGDPVAFGGIWEEWESPADETLRTFATITTEANLQLAMIQPRMPVIIEKADWPTPRSRATSPPCCAPRRKTCYGSGRSPSGSASGVSEAPLPSRRPRPITNGWTARKARCRLPSFDPAPLPSVRAREAILPIPLKSPRYFDLVDRSQRCRKGKG